MTAGYRGRGHPTRRRIVAILLAQGTHVSQLARDLEVSRPVLHVHLARMEAAGLVTSSMRVPADGKALRYLQLQPFDVLSGTEIDGQRELGLCM